VEEHFGNLCLALGSYARNAGRLRDKGYLLASAKAHTRFVLMAVFPSKPGFAGCMFDFPKRVSWCVVYGAGCPSWCQPAQQKHTGLHFFCIRYDSCWGRGIPLYCVSSATPVPLGHG